MKKKFFIVIGSLLVLIISCASVKSKNRVGQSEDAFSTYNTQYSFKNLCTKEPTSVSVSQLESWAQNYNGQESNVKIIVTDPDIVTQKNLNMINLSRLGGVKALYLTSFVRNIDGITDISDNHCLVFAVDLQKVWGDNWEEKWNILVADSAIVDQSFDKASQPFVPPSQRDQEYAQKGWITTSRLAYTVVYPTNYNTLIEAPVSHSQLPHQREIIGVGGYKNGIPCGPRLLHIYMSTIGDLYRLYFVSGDPSSNEMDNLEFPDTPPHISRPNDAGELPYLRTGRDITGFEAIQQLPNGLLRFMIWRNPGNIGTCAVSSGVIDPGNSKNFYKLINGRSCIGCHSNGIRGARVDTADKGNGWSTQTELDVFFDHARLLYFETMSLIVDMTVYGKNKLKVDYIEGRTQEPVIFSVNFQERSLPDTDNVYSCLYNQGQDNKYRSQIIGWQALETGFEGDISSQSDLIKGDTAVDDNLVIPSRITWSEHILPMISSRELGKKYDCITCHTSYKDFETVSSADIFEPMIKSMRGDGVAIMPKVGDPVPEPYIQMFERWTKNPLFE